MLLLHRQLFAPTVQWSDEEYINTLRLSTSFLNCTDQKTGCYNKNMIVSLISDSYKAEDNRILPCRFTTGGSYDIIIREGQRGL